MKTMMEGSMMGMGMPMGGMGMGMGAPMMNAPAMNMMMVPRCTMSMEKMDNGMKMMCMCPDATACAMMQNLCTMMSGGMMSCCMMMNGMCMMTCNMSMGMCKCEMTKDGMMMTWTSGDAMVCDMIKACCDAMMKMMECGCTCCMMMNNTPICCCTM